jgi:hypothetical protein
VSYVIHINFMRSGYHFMMITVDHTLTSLESDEIVFSFWIISSFLTVLTFNLFTHAVVLRSMIFVSISFVRVWHELIFVIASIEFVSSSISSNFCNLSSFVWLTKTHQIDHQSLFWRDIELDETVIQRSRVS